MKRAQVLIDDKYLRTECGIFLNSIVFIASTHCAKDGRVITYQIEHPPAKGQITMRPHELKVLEDEESIKMDTTEEKVPFTWAHLKEFCNSLTNEQLSKVVYLSQEDSSIEILYASELGDDHYKFTEEEYSFSRADFDKLYHFDGKYETLEEAMANEEYVIVPGTNVYLFDL